MRRLALLALSLAAASGMARAQAAPSRNLSEAAADPLLDAGLKAMYNLDYSLTDESAETFIRRRPANPLGPLYQAGVLWWQAATEGARGKPDERLLEAFHKSVDRTVDTAKEHFKSDDVSMRADGYFAAGMALGLEGQMRLVEGDYLKAYRSGKKAIRYLKKCVKTDPRYYDAYFGLGVFDYQVAVLPGALKFGAKMLLRGTGDARRGLERIRLAVDKGSFASRQAAGFLLTLYVLNEKDYAKAMDLAAGLRDDFPESPYFHFIELMMLHRNGRDLESYHSAKALFDAMSADQAAFRKKQLGTLCGLYGAACLNSEEDIQAAHIWLTMASVASENEGGDARWTAYLYFMKGLATDLLGQRQAAIKDYAKSLQLPDFLGTHAWAKACENKPCLKERALRYLAGEKPY